MRAHRAKKLRMKESHAQGAIASHGDSADAARFAARGNAVAFLNRGHEFLQEEIVVAEPAVVRIHEETGITGRRDDEEIAKFVAVPQLFDQIESAGAHEHLLVVAESMEVIEHGIAAVGVFAVTRRQNHAIRNSAPQDAAGQRETLAASFG